MAEIQEIDEFLNQNEDLNFADMDIDDDPAANHHLPANGQAIPEVPPRGVQRAPAPAVPPRGVQRAPAPAVPPPRRQAPAPPLPVHQAPALPEPAAQPEVARQQHLPAPLALPLGAYPEDNGVDNRAAPGAMRRGNRGNIPVGEQDIAGAVVPPLAYGDDPAAQGVAADGVANRDNRNQPYRGARGGQWVQRRRMAQQYADFLGFLAKSAFKK